MSSKCPECEEPLRTVCADKRMRREMCYECGWKGEPYIPEKKEVLDTKEVFLDPWHYVIYDQYGYSMIHSQGYPSGEDCFEAASKNLERLFQRDGIKYEAIVWPPKTIVQGIRVTL